VFFSFWLSHVPNTQFREFWQLVESCLAPGGRVFFIDSVRQQASTSVDQSVPSSGDVMARTLNDGRSFRVFKIYYDPAALERRLGELGWRANVCQTSRYFIVGTAERATG
jgi:demethylmenaquinone methyltransferase/2-methoxy-6-polyprenyl-1,4-benzoquinol methylase